MRRLAALHRVALEQQRRFIAHTSGAGFKVLQGCGLDRTVQGPRTGDYLITLGIIAPHIDLATDGKEPALAPFSEAIATVLRKACGAAHRAMDKPPSGVTATGALGAVPVVAVTVTVME